MSISRNVGGMSTYLSALRTAEAYTGMKMGVTKALKKVPKVGTALVDTMRKTKAVSSSFLFRECCLKYGTDISGTC